MLDLRITKYLLEFTCKYLQQRVNVKAVKDMDHRLYAILQLLEEYSENKVTNS